MYANMHARMHACINTNIHAYILTCMHTYIHTYVNTCIHAYMHASIHACMHACTHPYMHTCLHACLHMLIHMSLTTYIITSACTQNKVYTYMHKSVHTCMPSLRRLRKVPRQHPLVGAANPLHQTSSTHPLHEMTVMLTQTLNISKPATQLCHLPRAQLRVYCRVWGSGCRFGGQRSFASRPATSANGRH